MKAEIVALYKTHREMCGKFEVAPLSKAYFEKVMNNVLDNPRSGQGGAYLKILTTAFDLAKYLQSPHDDPIMEYIRNNIHGN